MLLLYFWANFSRILNKISDFFLKKLYFYNFSLFVYEFITILFWYPDPDQLFLIRIRNRVRPNDTDPDPKHCFQGMSWNGHFQVKILMFFLLHLYISLIF